MKASIQEIEVRFLEVDHIALKKRLFELGAQDLGEDYLKEILFYHKDSVFSDNKKRMVRIRQSKSGIQLAMKHQLERSATGMKEIEFGVDDVEKTKLFLEENGWYFARFVEKKRHSFKLNNVEIDLDMLPKVPPFVEIEGESEGELKETATLLGLNWNNVEYRNSRAFLMEKYQIPLDDLTYYTFDRYE